MKMFKGKMRYRQKEQGEWGEWSKFYPNLFVDDGKELALDFLFGLMSWWNPKEQSEYSGGDSGWDTTRYVQLGESMFNNRSREYGSGIMGIPDGSEYNYQIADTFMVEPTDSFITSPVGSRVVLQCERHDQRVNFRAVFDCPGDIPTETNIREIGVFLKATGPLNDPSLHRASRPYSIVCRSTRFGSGFYNAAGATGAQGAAGFEPCYKDDPIYVTDDVEIEWNFGEYA